MQLGSAASAGTVANQAIWLAMPRQELWQRKKRDEPKGRKPSGSRIERRAPKKKRKQREDRQRKGWKAQGEAKNKGKPKGRAVEDGQSDQVMAMRSHHLSGLGPGTRTNELNEAEPLVLP